MVSKAALNRAAQTTMALVSLLVDDIEELERAGASCDGWEASMLPRRLAVQARDKIRSEVCEVFWEDFLVLQKVQCGENREGCS